MDLTEIEGICTEKQKIASFGNQTGQLTHSRSSKKSDILQSKAVSEDMT